MSANSSEQKPLEQETPPNPVAVPREYDTSGIYPAEGKPFRLWGLLFWNMVVIVVIAVISAILNWVLI